jgi:hypothetical protein
MLDPRIYRAGLVAVALAVIVFAFSFQNQPGALQSSLAPDAFNAQYAFGQMRNLAQQYPERPPGSVADDDLAADIAGTFGHEPEKDAFAVSTDMFDAHTAAGTRTLENVVATRTGTENGSIVVIAHRDASGSPSMAAMSGTATLLSLANVLAGATLHRTIVLASTSGSVGASGVARLASTIPGPIDAVIVLGDMAGTRVREPVVVPWSNGVGIAPLELRETIASALSAQSNLRPGGTSLVGQFVHLAFPLTVSEQGAFGAQGIPAALVSASGERGPAVDEPVSEAQLNGLGRTVLATITALDDGPSVPPPSAYMLFDGKEIPPWAIRLFVLVLILPVLLAAVDGLARANRRGYSISRSALSVLAASVPFALAVLAVLGAKLTGLLAVAPPDPVGPGTVPIHDGDVALIVGLGCVIVGAFALGRWLLPHGKRAGEAARARAARARAGAGPGAGDDVGGGTAAVVPLIMCAIALAIWVKNPLAAALLVPALHLWIWIVDPEVRLHPLAALALLLVGLAPLFLVVFYYMSSLGFGPGWVLWSGVLMVAGGHIGLVAALEWCIVLGCTVSVAMAGLRVVHAEAPEQMPVTVRGPVTYAGPGSLGGTESALKGPAIRR